MLSALSIALGGCATTPNFATPAINVPATWFATTPAALLLADDLPKNGQSSERRMEKEAQWWQQFADEVLSELINRAQKSSPTLSRAWAKIAQARATLASTSAKKYPSLNLNGGLTHSNTRSQNTNSDTVSISDSTGKTASLDASWEIDLFGKTQQTETAAQTRVNSAMLGWHSARISLAAEVADVYVQYRACGLLHSAYEEALRSIKKTETATLVLVKAGFSAVTEGALARASTANLATTTIKQQTQCELLLKSLVHLTDSDEADLRQRLADHHDLPRPAIYHVPSVPAEALRQRPDIVALEREVFANRSEISSAIAGQYPSLSLSGSISVLASSLMTTTTAAISPLLALSLFDGGNSQAQVDSAKAAYIGAFANYREGIGLAVKEIEQALVNLNSVGERIPLAQNSADEYQQYFAATQQLWHAGTADLITLEQARRNALSAQISEITLQQNHLQYWIALYKAIGGGWQESEALQAPKDLPAWD